MKPLRRFFTRLLPSLPEGLFLATTAGFLFITLLLFFHFQWKNEAEGLRNAEKTALSGHTETAYRLKEQVSAARAAGKHFYLTDRELETLLAGGADGLPASEAASDALPFDALFLLRDADGASFSAPPICSPALAASLLAALPEDGGSVLSLAKDPADGRRLLCACSRIFLNGENYRLLTAADVDGFWEKAASSRRVLGVSALLLSLFAGAAVFFTAKLLTRPLKKLSGALEAMANGDFDLRLPAGGFHEKKMGYEAYNKAAGAVETSMETLRASSEGRRRFAGSMAHEMKTPLTSILCMGDILRIKREVSGEQRRELAGVIVEEAKRMRALSSKLLELSSAESGELEWERLPVSSLLEDVAALETPILALRGVKLTVINRVEACIVGDRELLKSLLCNLIDNAAKASERGKTVGLASTQRLRGGKGQVLIAVVDEGIGMTGEEVLLATEPFYMADKARSRKAGGVGLGLSLCKEIAARHNATLSIRSQKGKGTTVVLRMPLSEEKEKDEASPPPEGRQAERRMSRPRGGRSRRQGEGRENADV